MVLYFLWLPALIWMQQDAPGDPESDKQPQHCSRKPYPEQRGNIRSDHRSLWMVLNMKFLLLVLLKVSVLRLKSDRNGTFTLDGSGTGNGNRTRNRNNGFLYIMSTVHTALRQGQEQDPLFSIVLVLFPVPVLVLCSMNRLQVGTEPV